MSTYISKEMHEALAASRKAQARGKVRFRAEVSGQRVGILELHETGFTALKRDGQHMRGFVDIYEGSRHLYQALIVASEEGFDDIRYEFKRLTAAHAHQPRDYVETRDEVVALLT